MQVGYAKIVILDEYLAIGSMTGEVWTTTATVDRAVYRTDRHASVNLVYLNQHGRPRRSEQNLIVRRRKSEAEVTNNEIALDVLHYWN